MSNRFSLPSRTPLTFTLKTSQNARLELEASNATEGKTTSLRLEIALKITSKGGSWHKSKPRLFFVLGIVIFRLLRVLYNPVLLKQTH